MKIFSEETIYHLGDRYVEYIKDYKKKKQDEFRSIAVFPCRLKIIPTVSEKSKIRQEFPTKNYKSDEFSSVCRVVSPRITLRSVSGDDFL